MGFNFHMLYRIGKSNSMDIFYGVSLRGGGDDKMCWKPSKRSGFEVRGYYRVLIRTSDQLFPWKSKWKSKICSRVAFFVWTAALGKIVTIGNLHKRNIWILDYCYTCKCNGEIVDHLLLHYPIAMVFGSFGVLWAMPRMVIDLQACWQGRFGQHRNGVIWMAAPHCLMWFLWRERNDQCFEDSE